MAGTKLAEETDATRTKGRRAALLPEDFQPPEESVIVAVPVDKLGIYEGIVSSDVVGRGGATILPAGVDLSLLESSLDPLIQKMRAHDIREVRIRSMPQFSEQDIEEVFDRIYTDDNALVSREQARGVVKQVDTLFTSVRKQEFEPEMLSPLTNMGVSLTEEILRNPSVAFSLGKVQDADEYTFIHSFNVAVLAGFLTNRLHPGDRDYLQRIVVGSLLHDVGKARIPAGILNKPGPLTAQEFNVMKTHPALGVELARSSGVNDEAILGVVGGHHEKWSGKGYPAGLKGTEISESARIAAVADVFDALTAKRVYKNPVSSRDALTLIMRDAGGHFDPKVARELLESLGLYPPGSVVALSDGSVGLVVSNGGRDLVRPVLLIKTDRGRQSKNPTPTFLDLKRSTDLYIVQYLGHDDKRSLEEPQGRAL